MTIGIRAKMAGATQEQFEKVDRLIDLKGNPPRGLVFRAAGPIDGGWGVISFWESRQDFDTFQPRIAAAISASGVEMQGPPDINEFPVQATFQP